MAFPIPTNEEDRLEFLEKLDILDSIAESSYDFVVETATRLFDMPVAYVSFIDENRQWFKAEIGVGIKESPRNLSICTHTIMDDEPLIVEDLSQDPRFADFPYVEGDPKFRFYAGSPISLGDNLRIGTVCVMDHKPRKLTGNDRRLLEELTNHVSDLVKIRQISNELREKTLEVEVLQRLIPMCSWCGKIRDDDDYWQTVEEYITSHKNTKITHSICGDCSSNLNEDLELI